MRTCGCACGGTLTAYRGGLDELGAVVAAHSRTLVHRAWRRNREKVQATAAHRRRVAGEISRLRLLRALELERLGLRP